MNKVKSWIPAPSINPEVTGDKDTPYVTVDGVRLEVTSDSVDNAVRLTSEQTVMVVSPPKEFFVVGGSRPTPGLWIERDEWIEQA